MNIQWWVWGMVVVTIMTTTQLTRSFILINQGRAAQHRNESVRGRLPAIAETPKQSIHPISRHVKNDDTRECAPNVHTTPGSKREERGDRMAVARCHATHDIKRHSSLSLSPTTTTPSSLWRQVRRVLEEEREKENEFL